MENVYESDVCVCPLDVPDGWLESVPTCPVCSSGERYILAEGMADINYRGVGGTWDFKRCRQCGSAYLDPRISSQAIGNAYVNYETHAVSDPRPKRSGLAGLVQSIGDAYSARRYGAAGSHPLWKAALAYLIPMVRMERDFALRHARAEGESRRALDVGCGNGDFLVRLRDVGWAVRGIDFDPVAVSTARSRGLEVSLATLEGDASKHEVYNLVSASHVIEHVHDPVAFLQDLYKRVAPSGVLWLATPNINSPLRRIEGRSWNNWETPRHLQIFNSSSLKLIISRALGENTCIRFRRRGWHMYWSMAQSSRLRRGTLRGVRPSLPVWKIPVAVFLEIAALMSTRWGDELVVEISKPADGG